MILLKTTILGLLFFFIDILNVFPYLSAQDKLQEYRQKIDKCLSKLSSLNLDIRREGMASLSAYTFIIKTCHNDLQEQILDKLYSALEDDDDEIRRGAISIITEIDFKTKKTAKLICKILKDKDISEIEINALYLLEKIGRNARESVPILLKLLKDKVPPHDAHWDRHNAVIRALGSIGEGQEVIFTLCKTLKIPELGANSAIALGKIGLDAFPYVNKFIKSEDSSERALAIGALGIMGSNNPAIIIPIICKSFDDTDSLVRRFAIQALVNIKAKEKRAFSCLEKALNDSDKYVRIDACQALWFLESEKKKTILEVLTKLTEDENEFVKNESKILLNQLNKKRCQPSREGEK